MPEPVIQLAHAFLRAHSRGDLRFDENTRPLKYIVAPDGTVIAPVMEAMLRSVDLVLFVPADEDDAMEVMVTPERFEESGSDGSLADRWRIYHGEPEDVRWARLHIDAARFEGHIIDGEALTIPSPLASAEPALCKWLNQEHAATLPALCKQFGDAEAEKPVIVGVDDHGLDARRAFDVVRIVAPEPMSTEEDARRVVEAMIEASSRRT